MPGCGKNMTSQPTKRRSACSTSSRRGWHLCDRTPSIAQRVRRRGNSPRVVSGAPGDQHLARRDDMARVGTNDQSSRQRDGDELFHAARDRARAGGAQFLRALGCHARRRNWVRQALRPRRRTDRRPRGRPLACRDRATARALLPAAGARETGVTGRVAGHAGDLCVTADRPPRRPFCERPRGSCG